MKKMKKFKAGLALFLAAVLLVALFPHDGTIGQKVQAATTMYQTKGTTSSVTVKWTAPSGKTVTSYYIGWANSYDSAYTIAKSKKYPVSKSTTTYTISGLSADAKKYVYVCYTISGSDYVYTLDSCIAKTIAAKITKIQEKYFYVYHSTDKASFSFQWVEKNNVDGYQYQIYNLSGTKLYTGTSSYGSATYDSAKPSLQYKVRVRSYTTINGTKNYSAWSAYMYIVPQPTIKSASISSAGKLTISWYKVSSATSYEIYISQTSPRLGYSKVATVTSASTVKKTIATYKSSKFSKSSTYYVLVRATKKVGSKTYYSGTDYYTEVSPY